MTSAIKLDNYDWNMLVEDVCGAMGKLTGNVLAEKQRPMVESRMRRRLLELKLAEPKDYKEYWTAHFDEENKFLIGLLTTHFTSFFREFSHFEWIASHLPTLIAAAKAENRKKLHFWSAACSKGQEVYSLCMWLAHVMPKLDPTFEWTVFGTDIDPESVKEAENGVYHRRELETAPRHLWEGHWSRGTGEIEDWYKVKNNLKSHASFLTMNLLSINIPRDKKFDVVMCRNVLIYFDRPNQEKIINDLLKYVSSDGALITGMSESLNGYGLPIKSVSPSVYKKPDAPSLNIQDKVSESFSKPMPNIIKPIENVLPVPLKVFCIDDSPTVITIIKKVLASKDFEVVGTAVNGQDAIEKLKTITPDIITLDLHMPIMDGPTFLKTSSITNKIPVIVVSSVARDDDAAVAPLFAMGVSDFVEKPTLANIAEIGEELKQKLKMGWQNKNSKVTSTTISNAPKRHRPGGHIIFNVSDNDVESLLFVLSRQSWLNDHVTIILPQKLKDNKSHVDKINNCLKECKNVNYILDSSSFYTTLQVQTIWVNFKGSNVEILKKYKAKNHLVISEESTLMDSKLKEISDDITPVTSISYNLDKLLGGE